MSWMYEPELISRGEQETQRTHVGQPELRRHQQRIPRDAETQQGGGHLKRSQGGARVREAQSLVSLHSVSIMEGCGQKPSWWRIDMLSCLMGALVTMI